MGVFCVAANGTGQYMGLFCVIANGTGQYMGWCFMLQPMGRVSTWGWFVLLAANGMSQMFCVAANGMGQYMGVFCVAANGTGQFVCFIA